MKTGRNYRVPGKKLAMNMENTFIKADRIMVGGMAGQKEYLKSQGDSVRHLNPSWPSWRRVKRAIDKACANRNGKKPSAGWLMRMKHREHQEFMTDWADEAMGRGYY
jgi:hypothetical protein